MPLHGGIVPELHAQDLIVKKVDRILRSGANQAAQKCQREKAHLLWRCRQKDGHGQSVNWAQRQQQKAFAHLLGSVGELGVQLLQAIAREAVEEEVNKPARHSGAPFRGNLEECFFSLCIRTAGFKTDSSIPALPGNIQEVRTDGGQLGAAGTGVPGL